jgi:hypothetical protein
MTEHTDHQKAIRDSTITLTSEGAKAIRSALIGFTGSEYGIISIKEDGTIKVMDEDSVVVKDLLKENNRLLAILVRHMEEINEEVITEEDLQ